MSQITPELRETRIGGVCSEQLLSASVELAQ